MVAPAGIRVGMRDMVRAAVRSAVPGTRSEIEEELAMALGAKRVWWTCSGRAALFFALKALHALRPDRHVVAIPAYTCYSVAAAVVRAGLKLKLIEISPSLEPDYDSLESMGDERVLCIITAGLFGVPDDAVGATRVGSRIGAFVIEDIAQCLGASRQGRPAGTTGDVAICSFGRGKPLPLGQGGAIVARIEEVGDLIDGYFDQSEVGRSNAGAFLEVLLTSVFLRPSLYWIPDGLPFLKLGISEFNPDFPVGRGTRFSEALGGNLFGRLESLRQGREKRARRLCEVLANAPRLTTPSIPQDCVPNPLRLPVLAGDSEVRTAAVAALRSRGIGAAILYPTAICDIPGVAVHMADKNFHRTCAENLAGRLFSLPTHPMVSEADINMIGETLKELRV
jgi:dTDP-4-amino-4,6-dideoxygalactose transaminase